MLPLRRRVLALVLVLSMGAAAASPVGAGEPPQEELGRLRSADADLEDRLDGIQTWLAEGKDRLDRLDGQADAAAAAVEEAEAAVDRAEARVARQQAKVEERAVAAYVHPAGVDEIAFSDDLNTAAEQSLLVRQITEYDRELLDAKQRVEDRLAADEQSAEQARRDLESTRDEVTSLLDRLDEQRTDAEQARVALDARIEDLQAEVDAMASSSGGLADLINDLSANAGGRVGRLSIPVDGTLTSRFGQRWGRLHAGIDIAAPTGTPIRAAADGRTIYSGWMSGYGNVVILDHGGGISTLYGHQSRRRTAVGDRLDRGDVLGEVGSTGNSTGAHLHFEVRERGTPVDPIPYLSA